MFGTKLNISAEIKKLNNSSLTLEQLGNMLIYINKEYNKELNSNDYTIYRNMKSHELFMARQDEWERLLDLLNKRQDEIALLEEQFDETISNYYS